MSLLRVRPIITALLRRPPLCLGAARDLTTTATGQPLTLHPSAHELSAGRLTQSKVQAALEALNRDGIVVISDVVDHGAIDKLNDAMVKDAHTLIARGEDGPFNYNLGNLQASPPFDTELLSPSIFTNPVAVQLTNAWLRERPTMSFISSNIAVKSEQGQPVHSDADFDHPTIPFAAVVNVGLVDMHPGNGSTRESISPSLLMTELWLGTQSSDITAQEGAHGERASGRIKQYLLADRAKERPPLQPTVKKGSIIIRDLRLWHAGMPNRTDTIRVMLAMIHFAPWYRQRMTMRLPRTLRPTLDGVDRLNVAAEWVDGNVDHMDQPFGNAFDFSQDP